jgi:hypothetical protein
MTGGAGNLAEVLDSAETDLNGVSRSMLMADAQSMQESQVVLKHLVERLHRIKAAVGTPGQAWPPGTLARLQAFQGKLRRLAMLGASAISAVALRSQGAAFSTGGYTVRGVETLRPALSTVTLDC